MTKTETDSKASLRTYVKQMRGYYTAHDDADPRISIHIIKFGAEGIVPGAWKWSVSCSGSQVHGAEGWARTKQVAEQCVELSMRRFTPDPVALADAHRRYRTERVREQLNKVFRSL